MKPILTAILAIALIPLAACTKSGDVKEIKGYAVYKFINLGGIDVNALETNEAEARKTAGVDFDAWVEAQQLYASHGFDLHTPLLIQTETGEEVEVYVQTKDFNELWKVNPHDLAKQKKSHCVSIKYIQVKVGDENVHRAVSFKSQLVEREPIIRK